ncbi:MAG TPA: hypothetical protein VJ508_06730, partial [Saprospiraceae bacterium]|nr:hypothetical protein [Saprospiraceae bacterium]
YMNRRVEMSGTEAGVIQKKKTDPSKLSPESPLKNGNGHTTLEVEIKKEINKAESSEAVEEAESTPVSPNLFSSGTGDLAIPSLKGLSQLREKATLKHQEEKNKTPQLDRSAIQSFWNGFAENHSSQSLRHTMQEALVDIKGENTIVIRTGNQTGKNRLTAELNLLDGIRGLIRIPDLQIIVEIDPELDKNKDIVKPKKLLSSREKFEILSAKNPLMIELRDKLDLVPDQDE